MLGQAAANMKASARASTISSVFPVPLRLKFARMVKPKQGAVGFAGNALYALFMPVHTRVLLTLFCGGSAAAALLRSYPYAVEALLRRYYVLPNSCRCIEQPCLAPLPRCLAGHEDDKPPLMRPRSTP